MKFTKTAAALLLTLLTAFALTACSSKSAGADNNNPGARKIVIAAAPGYYPITYVDDNGNAAGYDVEVFKEIDKLLEDYTFTFEIADKETMNVGVQTGTYQVGINSLFKTEERQKTYLMPENNLGYTAVGIIQRKDSTYNTLQDLFDQHAKIYATGTSGGIPDVVDRWNAAHPNAQLNVERRANVVYADSLASVRASESDALIQLIPVFNLVDEQARAGLKISDPVDVVPTYCIVNKEEAELNELINEKLAELRDNGTLSELSKQFFGYDVFDVSK